MCGEARQEGGEEDVGRKERMLSEEGVKAGDTWAIVEMRAHQGQ